jgi:hypothetical protein
MNDLLDLYAKPHDLEEPVVCLDEKSKQLIADIRPSLPVAPSQGQRVDCHYKRHGTQNIFVAVEPKAGRRTTRVTQRRQRQDYAQFLAEVLAQYPDATKVHIIHDNLNIHAPEKLPAFFLQTPALLAKAVFHPTPVHASWLNPAELEIGAMDRQCLDRRIPDAVTLRREVDAWTAERNQRGVQIRWTFTREKAEVKFKLKKVAELMD